MSSEQANLAVVRAYFAALSDGPTPDTIAAFYSADAIQEEFPNALLRNGTRRTLKELREGVARGRQIMASQVFELINAFAQGDTVVVEAAWSGTLAVPLGDQLPAGSVMRARFAQFFELRDGKIVAQRNYDCFYPW